MSITKAVAGVSLGLIVVVAAIAWQLGFFTEAPEQATIEAAVEAVGTDSDDQGGDDQGGDDQGGDEAGSRDQAEVEPGAEPMTDISGTWTVDAGEEATFVGYRINEVLTTVGDFEVVGRTSDVSGTLEADSTSISAVALTVQLDTLTSDSDRRDNAMRSQALETSQFPEATFVLTSPIEVDSVPAEGQTLSVTATGELAIHGVTQTVDFPLEAQIVGDSIVVVGQLDVLLSDFDIAAPSAPIVASVDDAAVLELSVVFRR